MPPEPYTTELQRAYATVKDHRDSLQAENERLRKALDKAAGRLGYLSTVLSLANKANNAKGAWEWSEEARAALISECRI